MGNTVKYKSEDGVFEAPLDTVWKYLNTPEDVHKHTAFKSFRPQGEPKGNVMTFKAEVFNPDGKTTHEEVYEMTMTPPKGFVTHIKAGPLSGGKFTHTYIADGNKTKVHLEGEFPTIPGMDEKQTHAALDQYFNTVFEEDNSNIKKFKA